MQGFQQVSGNLENFLLSVVDVTLMMQNAALAAESLGLGFCYIGGIRNHPSEVRALFNLPPLVFPLNGMTLGWLAKPGAIRPRLPLPAVLHWESYHPEDERYLRAYDRTMIGTGIYAGRQVSGGDDLPDEEYGWLEHTARRASKPSRVHLRDEILIAGFGLS